MTNVRTVSIKRHGMFGRTFTPDLKRCRESVPEGGRSVGSHQCNKKAKVVREVIVQGEEERGVQSIGFCTIHDPEYVAAKREAEQAKWKADREHHARLAARRQDRPADYVKVLREIAAGHNDPRALAAKVLAKWSDAS